MRNQARRALEKLLILVGKCVRFVAFGIEHPDDVPVLVSHWNDNFRPRRVKRWQVAFIFLNVAHHDCFARLQRGAA